MASIQGVYVALFGRPADPTGLAFFNAATNNGGDLTKIGDLAATKEYKDRFDGQSNLQIVRSIYQSLFNRDPEPTGLNFFVDALNKGTLNINNIAIAILDGAQGSDKTTVDNKIKSADLFTAAIDTPEEIAAYSGNAAAAAGRAYLAGVTSTAKTEAQATDAVKAVVVIGTGGVTISVLAADTVGPDATKVELRTSGGDDKVTVTNTFTAANKVDGGFGSDTLVIADAQGVLNAAALKDKIVGFESIVATAKADASFDLTDVKGVTSVKSVDSAAFDLAFTGLAGGTKLAIEGKVADAAFGFTEADAAATSLTLTKADATTLAISNSNSVINIATSGGSKVAGFNAGEAKTINISGSGDVTGFALAAAADKITKVDASGLEGKLTISLVNADNGIKITGTANADDITLSAAGKADTVIYTTAEKSNYALAETISTFTQGADKIDLTAFGFTKTGAATLTNIQDNAAVFGTSSVALYNVDTAADGWTAGDYTWAFIDKNNDGILQLGTDIAIKVVGSNAFITAADFVLTA